LIGCLLLPLDLHQLLDSNGLFGQSVFKLVLTARSDVFVTTHGTGFDTSVYMRNGCCGAEIACNDDACGLQAAVCFHATAGQQYLIRLGNFPGAAPGAGQFSVAAWQRCIR
jgi:hypothetical protein